MATITEDYVSFETAKLLKEKGFNEACWSWYHNGNNTHTGTSRYCNSELEKYDFSKATLAHAMKWLREVHHIFIQVELYSKYNDYCFEVFQNTHRLILEKHETFNNYEEACEAAIKYCMENII